jgi:hypothetical protein
MASERRGRLDRGAAIGTGGISVGDGIDAGDGCPACGVRPTGERIARAATRRPDGHLARAHVHDGSRNENYDSAL